MDLNEHIRRKELINLRESSLSDWREEIKEEGDHPYVDVMPSIDPEEDMKEGKHSRKKKEKEKRRKKRKLRKVSNPSEHRSPREADGKAPGSRP